jgi:hypothetical protein
MFFPLPRAVLALAALAVASALHALIPDPGFESGGDEWIHFCPPDSKAAGASLSISAASPRAGKNALRLDAPVLARHGATPREPIAVAPGERYRFSVWLRADESALPANDSAGGLVRLTLLNAGRGDAPGGHYFVGLDNWIGRDLQPPARARLPRDWVKTEVVLEIPAGTAYVVPTLFAWRVRGVVYFDDVVFEKVPAGTPLTTISTTSGGTVNSTPPSAPPAAELLTPAIQRELFAALDLAQPALTAVREAVARDDFPAAVRAFAGYLRTRDTRNWFVQPFDPASPDPSKKYRRERAESAAVGRVTPGVMAELWHTFPDNIIDWFRNETRHHPGMPFNGEWQWQLCRMDFWADMADAYRATADEKYPAAWVVQFRSFIAQCPAPTAVANDRESAWRTIESGIRMRDSWPRAYFAFLRSPSVTDEDLLLYVYSNIQHARYLQAHPSDWGNWLTMEMCGLHTVGTMFPELKDAVAWRRFAIETMHASTRRQFLPDGAQYELTPGYHIVALDENGMAIPRLARATGRLDEIPADYIAAMEKGYDYLLRLMTPDRSQPRFNDSWPVTWLRRVFENGLIFFPQRDDWRWIATDGRQGRPPAETSHAFPYAGYYVMRSGWERDANYVAFDAGTLGYTHSHQDKLNLVVYAYGREILFDGGGGSYENSKWRAYAIDAFSHNTVLVDGMPQRRQLHDRDANVSRVPNDVVWQSAPDHDFAAGVYDGAFSSANLWSGPQPRGPVTHTRRVFFAKPDLVVVADTLVPDVAASTHTYQARWQLLPVKAVTDPITQAVTTADEGLSNLAVIPLRADGLEIRAVSGQTEPELIGWHIRKDMNPQYVPATTVTHTRSGAGTQTFVTLLYPLRPGETNPVKTVSPLNATDTRVTLAGGRHLLITVSPDPKGPITLTRE